jgi:protein-S-isoprenylcysteine O-methyltransferase Ste14
MFARALIAFVALPGPVAFVIPAVWLWFSADLRPVHPPGLAFVAVGCAALLWCVRDFYVAGRGTLAPWAPPERLVIVGLYRYSRNPMYVAVAMTLLGWAVSYGSPALMAYTLVVGVAFHLRVVYGEEPWLARRHGEAWQRYADRVPRWF